MQRTSGIGRLAIGAGGLETFFQEGAAKIRMPKRPRGAPAEAVLINTAGGLTDSDRMDWSIRCSGGADLTVTTQASEKIYKAATDVPAVVDVTAHVAEDSRLAWLPQETILFDGSRLRRRLSVDIAPGGRFLAAELIAFGRPAHGEIVSSGAFRDRWRVRHDGTLTHAEDLRLNGAMAATLARPSVGAGAGAVATLLLVADDVEADLRAARQVLEQVAPDARETGLAAWTLHGHGKLLARFVAKDSYDLRKTMVPLLGVLNTQAGLPKVWSL